MYQYHNIHVLCQTDHIEYLNCQLALISRMHYKPSTCIKSHTHCKEYENFARSGNKTCTIYVYPLTTHPPGILCIGIIEL